MRKWQAITAAAALLLTRDALAGPEPSGKSLLANLNNLADKIDRQSRPLALSHLQLAEQKKTFSNFARETANKLADDLDSLASSIEVSHLETGAESTRRRNFKDFAKAASDKLARDIDASFDGAVSHIEIEDKAKVADAARQASTAITQKMAEWAEKYNGDATKLREMLSQLAQDGSKLFADHLDQVLPTPAPTTTAPTTTALLKKKRLGEKAKSATLALADYLDQAAAQVEKEHMQQEEPPTAVSSLAFGTGKMAASAFLETADDDSSSTSTRRTAYYERLTPTLRKAQDAKLASLAADIAEIHDRLLAEVRKSGATEDSSAVVPVSALQFSWGSMFAELGSLATQKISDYVSEFAAEAKAEHEKDPDSSGFLAAVSGFSAAAFGLFAEKMSDYAESYQA